jgi:high affinity sulfate transporter 1
VSSLLPLFEWLPGLRKQSPRSDVVAGLTSAAVVIPQSMGYATLAGLPIQVGLYTAFVPMIVYTLLGTSRVLSVSTTSTLAVLTIGALRETVPNADEAALLGAMAALTFLVGAALILAALLRLGFIANFISEPVLVGFKTGVGIVIIIDQVPKILGIHFAKGSFIHNLQSIGLGLAHTSIPTLILGLGAIAGFAGLKRFRPQWPAPLIVVALTIAGVAWLGWEKHGIELVGMIPTGLPHVSVPSLNLTENLWPAALGMAFMSFVETAAAGRAFARTDEPPPRENAELLATGVANALGALLGSMPSGGGTSQTAVNRMAGARSQIAGLVTAMMALLAMLLLSPFIALMPQAVLASIVIFYSASLIKPDGFRAILHVRRREFLWALVAAIGVVLIGTLRGILVAIIVSLVALAEQSVSPPVYVLGRKPGTNVFRPRSGEHPEDESFPGLLLLRLDGRLFFLNAERTAQKIQPLLVETHPKVVAIDFSGVFDLEYTALKTLTEADQRMQEAGVQVWLVGLNPEVLAVVQRSPLGSALGRQRLHFDLEIAVRKYLDLQHADHGDKLGQR